jgi:hypothetical protein
VLWIDGQKSRVWKFPTHELPGKIVLLLGRGSLFRLRRLLWRAGSLLFGTTWGPRLSAGVATIFPDLGNSFRPATWTVIAVTTVSLIAALSGRFRAVPQRTERVGTFFLLFLLTTLGAQASFGALREAPAFLAVGAVGLLIHGATLLVGARVSRLPLALLATSSQSCVGGSGFGTAGGGGVSGPLWPRWDWYWLFWGMWGEPTWVF